MGEYPSSTNMVVAVLAYTGTRTALPSASSWVRRTFCPCPTAGGRGVSTSPPRSAAQCRDRGQSLFSLSCIVVTRGGRCQSVSRGVHYYAMRAAAADLLFTVRHLKGGPAWATAPIPLALVC